MGLLMLVRHGQASFGADDYDVLSDLGWEQARQLGGALAHEGLEPTVVVRGDMRRHRETLEAVAQASRWPVDDVVVDPGWNEFDHLSIVAGFPGTTGAPTGGPAGGEETAPSLDRRAFQRLFEEATARWTAGEGDYDESYDDFRARVRDALDRASAAAGSGRTGVVVTSGGVIAAVAAALVDPDGTDPAAFARLWQRFNTVVVNTSVTKVVVGSTGARLLTFNEHQHLPAALVSYR